MNKENYEGLRKQLDNGSLDIPSQITILEIAYNLEQQLKAYKDIINKAIELTNKIIDEGWDYEEKDNIAFELREILKGDDKNE